MLIAIVAAHPLMLERMRLLLRSEHEVHAFLLPEPERMRGWELPAAQSFVIDAHDSSLLQQVLLRMPRPGGRVLAVGEEFEPALAFSLMFLGVRGMVRYDRMDGELPRAVRAVEAGAYWVPRLVMAGFVDHLLERFPHPEAIAPLVRLSSRERQVLDGVLSRATNKEIAAQLNLSERTVKFHVSNVLRKFRVTDRHDLTLCLMQQGSASLPQRGRQGSEHA